VNTSVNQVTKVARKCRQLWITDMYGKKQQIKCPSDGKIRKGELYLLVILPNGRWQEKSNYCLKGCADAWLSIREKELLKIRLEIEEMLCQSPGVVLADEAGKLKRYGLE